MAIYIITCACGHDQQIRVNAPQAEHAAIQEREAQGVCRECERKRFRRGAVLLDAEAKAWIIEAMLDAGGNPWLLAAFDHYAVERQRARRDLAELLLADAQTLADLPHWIADNVAL